ncbi:MAG: ectoine/hydroxyectoine ABC transporter substrate-binding protein EhuB, partial [Geminicoccaceae bacterium]
ALAVAFVGIPPVSAEGLMDQATGDGLRVAFYNFKPYAYVDDNNDLVGTDVEILETVLAKMGGKVGSADATDWGALIPGVKAGRFDVVAAGMFVTPKRCAEVRFSEPTFGIKQALAVMSGNPAGIDSYETIRDNGLKVGAVAGAAQVGYAQQAGIEDANITQLPDNPTGIAALRAGRIDAWAVSAPGVREIVSGVPEGDIESSPVFDQIGGQLAVSHGAYAFRPEDGDFVDAFNAELTAFIGTAEHIAIMEKHGMTPDELPIQKTDELCEG